MRLLLSLILAVPLVARAVGVDAVLDWQGATLSNPGEVGDLGSWADEAHTRFAVESRPESLLFPGVVTVGGQAYSGNGTNWIRSDLDAGTGYDFLTYNFTAAVTNLAVFGFFRHTITNNPNQTSLDMVTMSSASVGYSVFNLYVAGANGPIHGRVHTDGSHILGPQLMAGVTYPYLFERNARSGYAQITWFDLDTMESIGSASVAILTNSTTYRLRFGSGYIGDVPGDAFHGPLALKVDPTQQDLIDLVTLATTWRLPMALGPTTNATPWLGLVGAGVLTNRTTFTNMASIDASGVSDVSGAINAAISACPAGQAVVLPGGIFRCDSILSFPHTRDNITLRGSTNTTLVFYGTTGYGNISCGDYASAGTPVAVTSGATQGSSNLTVASTSGFVVGLLAKVSQTAADYVFSANGSTSEQSTTHRVTGTNATTITVWPPLPMDLTNSPTIAPIPSYLLTGVGFEDFKVDLSNATNSALLFQQTDGCWIRNVEVFGAAQEGARAIQARRFVGGTITDCYIHDALTNSHSMAAIELYSGSCWNLIENNRIKSAHGIELGNFNAGGNSGNVIAYNSVEDKQTDSVAGYSINVNHGGHNAFNLVEGNVVQMLQSDGYYGSSSHTTFFRNYSSGNYTNLTLQRAVSLERWSYWFTVAGNVLGYPGAGQTYESYEQGEARALVWRLGYPNLGNSTYSGTNPPSTDAAALDLNVKDRALLVNNYDYATQGIADTQTNLPASLYLAAAPSWWGAGAWPPIGPNLTPMVGTIPAQSLGGSGSSPSEPGSTNSISITGSVVITGSAIIEATN